MMNVSDKDATIRIMPVAVYPKKYIGELRDEPEEVKSRIASGEQPVFDDVDALFAKPEAD